MLVAGQLKTPMTASLTARSLFDQISTPPRPRPGPAGGTSARSRRHLYLAGRDPAENRADTVSEWAFDGSYRLSRHWTGSAEWRYDVASDESVRAGVGVTYTNECDGSRCRLAPLHLVAFLEPSTDISLTVGLRGFTPHEDKSYVRTCNK